MGKAYLADATSLNRKIALKFLSDVFIGSPGGYNPMRTLSGLRQAVGIDLSDMDYLCRLLLPLGNDSGSFTAFRAAAPFGFGTSKIYGQFHLIAGYFAFNNYLHVGAASQN